MVVLDTDRAARLAIIAEEREKVTVDDRTKALLAEIDYLAREAKALGQQLGAAHFKSRRQPLHH